MLCPPSAQLDWSRGVELQNEVAKGFKKIGCKYSPNPANLYDGPPSPSRIPRRRARRPIVQLVFRRVRQILTRGRL